MKSPSCTQEPAPAAGRVALPRLTFRVGFAGTQVLPAESSDLSARLAAVFETIAQRLAEIAPGTPIEGANPVGRVAQFYSEEVPLLRVITGLCEGADALAGRTLAILSSHEVLAQNLTTELAAVVPFDIRTYRESRPAGFRAEFDEQAAQCAYIIALDGRYEKPSPDSALAKARRARAYRAQSALLLRQADLIVAAADPDGEGRAGGTMETVRAALEFDLPVVFVHTGTGQISIIEPADDPASAFAELAAGEGDWAEALGRWVTQLTADPDSDAPSANPKHDYGVALLEEYFRCPDIPPISLTGHGQQERKKSVGELLWNVFTGRCEPPGDRAKSDDLLQPYATWRARGTSLNYHYSGSYRGAFLLNYFLAAWAVAFAAFSLVLLGKADHTPAGLASHRLIAALLVLGLVKLGIVGWIFWNTHRANHGNWNDKAVDYRYLAERLRAMLYLPRVGSFQPPAAVVPQHATRAVRQSAVDWLVDAIVRSASPASLPFARTEPFDFDGRPYEAKVLRLEPEALLTAVRDRWVWEQSVYHDRTARTMERIHLFAETLGKTCNLAVIGFVAVDLALVVALLAGWVPKRWEDTFHGATPWLVFFAALLPAVVASLNGVRFQSECRRLAERSAVMRTILRGRDLGPIRPPVGWWREVVFFFRSLFLLWPNETPPTQSLSQRQGRWAAADRLASSIAAASANPATDPGSWTPEVLRLTESVAEVFVQEVAEWSVLYAKELPEP